MEKDEPFEGFVPPEINKELVLSTAHLKRSTMELLDVNTNFGQDCCGTFSGFQFDTVRFGWRFWTGIYLEDADQDSELYLLTILARSHGCKWLVLDEDGPVNTDLPVYSK